MIVCVFRQDIKPCCYSIYTRCYSIVYFDCHVWSFLSLPTFRLVLALVSLGQHHLFDTEQYNFHAQLLNWHKSYLCCIQLLAPHLAIHRISLPQSPNSTTHPIQELCGCSLVYEVSQVNSYFLNYFNSYINRQMIFGINCWVAVFIQHQWHDSVNDA